MAYNEPPSILSAPEIVPVLNQCIQKFRQLKNDLTTSITPEAACFDNVVLPWSRVADEVNTYSGMVWLLMYAAPDAETHEAIRIGSKTFNDGFSELMASRELFLLFAAVAEKQESLDPESAELVRVQLQDFLNAGHGSLSADQLNIYTKNKLRLADLKQMYMENLQKNQGGIWASLSELDGIPVEETRKWIGEGANGKHRDSIFIPFANGGRVATLTYAKDESLRKRMLLAEESKVPANVPLFRETVLLRNTQARLLGYENHAQFRIQSRAIKSIDYLHQFLANLSETLVPIGKQEIRELQELRFRDRKARNLYADGDEQSFPPWDTLFYQEQAMKDFGVDKIAVAEYFPLQHTVLGMLRLFEECLDLTFTQISPEQLASNKLWHDTVSLWETRDTLTGDFVGFLYLDLLMRERKYKGSQNMNIHCGYERADGTRQVPATVLMTAFPVAEDGSCVQLKHSQVVTLFHGLELGHGIHDLISKTKYSRFHGTRLPVDIGEMPSTLLENWCWEKSILKRLSCHFTKIQPKYSEIWLKTHPSSVLPPETISDELVDKIVDSRNKFRALYHLHQLTVSRFDLLVHDMASHEQLEKFDFVKIWYGLREELESQDFSEFYAKSHDHVTFGHLMNGYDVGYYSYLCCATFAEDIYQSQFKANPTDKEAWARLRDDLLRYGGSYPDQIEMIQHLLGREPSLKALSQRLSSQ